MQDLHSANVLRVALHFSAELYLSHYLLSIFCVPLPVAAAAPCLSSCLQERGGAQQPGESGGGRDRDEPDYSRGAGGGRQGGRERERSPAGDRDRRGGGSGYGGDRGGRDGGRDERGR